MGEENKKINNQVATTAKESKERDIDMGEENKKTNNQVAITA